MRNRPILRPQFETMESLTLLSVSSLHPLAAAVAQIHAQPERAAPTLVNVTLTGGSIKGKYVRLTTPKTATFSITSGTVSGVTLTPTPTSPQNARVTGSIVYNITGSTATSLKKATLTTTAGAKNSITLTLTLPTGSNPNTQFTFNYNVTKATGAFQGNQESGQVTFAGPFQFQRARGSYTANFI